MLVHDRLYYGEVDNYPLGKTTEKQEEKYDPCSTKEFYFSEN